MNYLLFVGAFGAIIGSMAIASYMSSSAIKYLDSEQKLYLIDTTSTLRKWSIISIIVLCILYFVLLPFAPVLAFLLFGGGFTLTGWISYWKVRSMELDHRYKTNVLYGAIITSAGTVLFFSFLFGWAITF